MELRNRISRVKKPLPNLGGRGPQLPPLDRSQLRASKRSFSVLNNQYNSTQGLPNRANGVNA